jgi:hypothetical protein
MARQYGATDTAIVPGGSDNENFASTGVIQSLREQPLIFSVPATDCSADVHDPRAVVNALCDSGGKVARSGTGRDTVRRFREDRAKKQCATGRNRRNKPASTSCQDSGHESPVCARWTMARTCSDAPVRDADALPSQLWMIDLDRSVD